MNLPVNRGSSVISVIFAEATTLKPAKVTTQTSVSFNMTVFDEYKTHTNYLTYGCMGFHSGAQLGSNSKLKCIWFDIFYCLTLINKHMSVVLLLNSACTVSCCLCIIHMEVRVAFRVYFLLVILYDNL